MLSCDNSMGCYWSVNDNGWGLDLAFPIVALSFSFSCWNSMSSACSNVNGLDQIWRDELLKRFVPIQVFSYSSVRKMKEQEIAIGLRRVEAIHVCGQCDYQTPNRVHLVNHNRTHTGVKPFQCETGQKSLSVKRVFWGWWSYVPKSIKY